MLTLFDIETTEKRRALSSGVSRMMAEACYKTSKECETFRDRDRGSLGSRRVGRFTCRFRTYN